MSCNASRWLTASLRKRFQVSAIAIFAIFAVIGGPAAAAGGAAPEWRIGRAVIESEEGGYQKLFIKVSLRNRGALGREPVAFFARWSEPNKGARRRRAGERADGEGRYVRLATYAREVALRRTVILEVPLRPLGPIPRRRPAIELLIRTGDRTTDRRTLTLPRP